MIRDAVVVTDGGRGASRSALATVRALAIAGYRPIVTTSEGRELAASSRSATEVARVPRATSATSFRRAIDALRARPDVLHVFATSDDALTALDPVAAALVNKSSLHDELVALGIPTPESRVVASARDLPDMDMAWPVVVKPVTGSAPAFKFEAGSDRQLLESHTGPVVVQPFLAGNLESVSGVIWNGSLKAAVHQRYERTWPVDCGTASYAATVAPDHDREEILQVLLGAHSGIFQAQYLDGFLIDVNPRPYGSMPLALRAGVNLPAIVCHQLDRAQMDGAIRRAAVGVRYRWIEGDLRHLLSSLRSRRLTTSDVVRALRPRSGTAHSVFDAGDPAPLIARLYTAMSSKTAGDGK